MIWVAWRQHRTLMLWGAVAVAAMTLFLIPTGIGMSHFFTSSGLARCLSTVGADCGDLGQQFDSRYSGYAFLVPLFLMAPVLFGMFFGAPLIAREMDGGTYRLAWTQGVSRPRWLSTKLAVVIGSALVGAIALALLVTWWSRPLITNGASRFRPGIFDLRGVVPIAYTIFAVMLGVAIGTLIKKTLPAVGVTLVAFAGVRVGIELFLRQHYMTAKTLTQSLISSKGPPGAGAADWIIRENTIDRLGHIVSSGRGPDFGYLAARCPALAAAGPFPKFATAVPGQADPFAACVQHLGLRDMIVYQPASRFWTFQWIEFGIFIALAIGLAVFTVWRTKRLS
ncbi:MAG TPA: ABC transporter permease [Actinomycetota bacterium]|nr:ABC transporter permease [Actinomycetota bacterium]